MAAPSSAYHSTPRLKIREGSTLVEDISFAKIMSPYGTTALTKSTFYLDKIIKDSSFSPSGFIGIVTTAVNIAMHASSRKFALKNGGGYYLRDAGLNTLGWIEITSITNEPKWANWINLPLYLLSSFYADSTDYGFSWKINSGSYTTVSTKVNDIPANGSMSQLIRQLELTGLNQNDTIYFKSYVTNSEGTFYGTEIYFTADEDIWYDGAYQVNGPNGGVISSAFTLYMTSSDFTDIINVTTSDASTGIWGYISEYFITSNKLATGWYVIGSMTTKAYYVINGEIRKYETRTPVNPHITLSFINKGTTENPDWRVFAQVVDSATGFPNTMWIYTELKYYTYSGGVYTQTGLTVNVDVRLTSGNFYAQSGLSINPPPGDAAYAQVTTSTSGIGMTIESPYVIL